MTIDEMYRLRKWTKSSRRFWGRQRPDKHTGDEQVGIPGKLKVRMYVNLLSMLFILIVTIAAAV